MLACCHDSPDDNELKVNSVADLIVWLFLKCGKHFIYFHVPKVTAVPELSVEEELSKLFPFKSEMNYDLFVSVGYAELEMTIMDQDIREQQSRTSP